jgi:cell wall-associated NlpC family hydrolase
MPNKAWRLGVKSMRQLLLIISVLVLPGCISLGESPAPAPPVSSTVSAVYQQLMAQHASWRGTPYQYGGTGRQGVDCSGFMQLTFLDKLNVDIPRSTTQQSRFGHHIGRSALQVGDLVFFKTDVKVRHVGVYLGNSQFLHASKSQGVMISSMDHIYWSPRYWMARRVF